MGYGDGTYPELGSYPLSGAATSATFNSGTSPSEFALAFTCPFSASCVGVWHLFTPLNGADHAIRLYNGTTLLSEQVMLGNWVRSSSLAISRVFFPGSVLLQPGTTYYLSVLARNTNNLTARAVTLPSAAMAEQLGYAPGLAPGLATRTGGAWNTSPTQIPAIGPLFDSIDDGKGTTPPPPSTFSGAPFSRIFTEF